MIEVQSLTRQYGKTIAVDDVSFHIGDNEIVGLLGHNGAGKTTIMRMLSGYLEPTAGSIVIGGVDLATQAQTVQQQLGYLPENLPVYPEMMVADYLDYAATLKGISKKERYQAVRGALLGTDLAKRALDPISTLSRGLRQRVGVAQAVLGRPRLLILDEPTNGLDPNQIVEIRNLIKTLGEHKTVVLSSHILSEVEATCDRVIILNKGTIVADRGVNDLRSDGDGRQRLLVKLRGVEPEQFASLVGDLTGVVKVEPLVDAECLSARITAQADADIRDGLVALVGSNRWSLLEMRPENQTLEDVFAKLTSGDDGGL